MVQCTRGCQTATGLADLLGAANLMVPTREQQKDNKIEPPRYSQEGWSETNIGIRALAVEVAGKFCLTESVAADGSLTITRSDRGALKLSRDLTQVSREHFSVPDFSMKHQTRLANS